MVEPITEPMMIGCNKVSALRLTTYLFNSISITAIIYIRIYIYISIYTNRVVSIEDLNALLCKSTVSHERL